MSPSNKTSGSKFRVPGTYLSTKLLLVFFLLGYVSSISDRIQSCRATQRLSSTPNVSGFKRTTSSCFNISRDSERVGGAGDRGFAMFQSSSPSSNMVLLYQ